MKRHMKIHTREMPCKCTEGEISFSQASHSDVPFRCAIQMCHSDVSFRCVIRNLIQMCHTHVFQSKLIAHTRASVDLCLQNCPFTCEVSNNKSSIFDGLVGKFDVTMHGR